MEMGRTAVTVPFTLLMLLTVFTPNTFAQTYLQFLELGSYGITSTIIPRADDGASSTISITEGFSIGSSTYNSAYISTNGLISLGQRVTSPSAPSSFSSTSNHVVAPFWGDATTTSSGSIFYEVHSSAAGSAAGSVIPLNTVSTFIRNVDGGTFSGTWMLAAEWYQVPQYGQSTSRTNTFQAILITDGSTSYTVFTYRCGSLQWGTSSVGIGFRADSSYYRNHPLSRSANTNAIACLNSPTNESSNVVYKLTSGVNCLATQFGCNNGLCVISSDRCDNADDCRDNSDEAACDITTYVGFEDTSYTVSEGTTTSSPQVCVTIKSGPPLSSSATVRVTSSSGSARAGSDFSSVSRTVQFQSGSIQGTRQCFTITTFSDNTFELTETFTLQLSNPSISSLQIQSISQSTTVYIQNTITTCSISQFTCTNLQCVFQSDRCDGFNDCSDNSDEIGCGISAASSGANVGLAVGLSVPAFIVFMFILIPCCIGISWYRRQTQFRSIPVTTITSSPSTNPTAAIITTTTTATKPEEGFASAPPPWGCEMGAPAHEPPPVYPGVGHDPYNSQQQYTYNYEGQQQNPPPYSGNQPTPSYHPQEQYTYPAPICYPVDLTGDGYPPPTYPTNH